MSTKKLIIQEGKSITIVYEVNAPSNFKESIFKLQQAIMLCKQGGKKKRTPLIKQD